MKNATTVLQNFKAQAIAYVLIAATKKTLKNPITQNINVKTGATMNFKEYQDNAIKTAKAGDFKFNLTHAAMGLAGEAGEFTDCIKKYAIYGQSLDSINAAEELGDVLWFVALACNTLGISMEFIADQNIAKLQKRYPEKYSDQHAELRLDKEGDVWKLANITRI